MVLSLERWQGKVAVVTGANSGIGAAIAKKLTDEGITVVGLDKNIEAIEKSSKLQSAKDKAKLHFYKTDLTREQDILNAFKWIENNVGPISILINNAGLFIKSSLLEGKTEDWKPILDVNLLGLCIASREAIKMMREYNIDGHIVNIKSIAGHTVLPGLQMYTSSKFAVGAATETIRQELNAIKSKIKIGCISPGTVDTPMVKEFLKDADPLYSTYSVYLKPEDIADAVVYVLTTPPHVQIQELVVRPVGEPF